VDNRSWAAATLKLALLSTTAQKHLCLARLGKETAEALHHCHCLGSASHPLLCVLFCVYVYVHVCMFVCMRIRVCILCVCVCMCMQRI